MEFCKKFYTPCNMKKHLTFIGAIIAVVAMALAPASAIAKEVTIGKLKYKVNTTDKIARCTGLATKATKNYNLTIPSTVTYNNVTLKVISVEKDAFWWDHYLKKVTLSDYTETIGQKAFADCINITEVNLGNKLKVIGPEAFRDAGLNGSWTHVDLPATVETIRDHAFADCRTLLTVTFGDKVKTIEASAFWNCVSLKTIVLPGSLQSIGENAFESCDALTKVTFRAGNGNTIIGAKCFNNLHNLSEVNFQGPGVAHIGASAFIGCRIQWLALPSSVVSVEEGAFCGNKLTLLELPEGLRTIGSYAFYGQAGLTNLIIPSTVVSIGKMAFVSAGYIQYVRCDSPIPPAAAVDTFSEWTKENGTLYVPAASEGAYAAAQEWRDFRYVNDKDSGVDEVMADADTDETWYDLMGNKVNRAYLLPGVYVVRRGNTTSKVAVR